VSSGLALTAGPFASPIGRGSGNAIPTSMALQMADATCVPLFRGVGTVEGERKFLCYSSLRTREGGLCAICQGVWKPDENWFARVGLPSPQRQARARTRPCLALRARRLKTGAVRRGLSPFVELSFEEETATIQIGSLVERRSNGANTKAANVDGRDFPSLGRAGRPRCPSWTVNVSDGHTSGITGCALSRHVCRRKLVVCSVRGPCLLIATGCRGMAQKANSADGETRHPTAFRNRALDQNRNPR
jgi:hypothetical protein